MYRNVNAADSYIGELIYTADAAFLTRFCGSQIRYLNLARAQPAIIVFFTFVDLSAVRSWAGDEASRIATEVNRSHTSPLAAHNTSARKEVTTLH